MKKLLIVEDDDFKLKEILELIETHRPRTWSVTTAVAMSTAIDAVNSFDFDRVILDMSIPSHPRQRGAGTALPLPTGGLEVLFELESLGRDGRCVILTQYPEIEIAGTLIPLEKSSDAIVEKFQCSVLGCILYAEDLQWENELLDALDK